MLSDDDSLCSSLKQDSLFRDESPEPIQIPIAEGELWLWHNWIPPEQQESLQQQLQQELIWEQSAIRLFGKHVLIPRLNAWYGDAGCHYGYSGHRLTLQPWHPQLSALRQRLSAQGLAMNSVLANWYRDGRDSNGWHSDDEPELGRHPVIASVSLGQPRDFHLRHKKRSYPAVKVRLESGSLLVMKGELQSHWQHAVPKSKRPLGSRINLTFRQILAGV